MFSASEQYQRVRTVDFDCPFAVGRSGMVHLNQGTSTPVPTVYHDDDTDVVIEGDAWELLPRYNTGQHGYNGAVMHASEQLSGQLLDDIVTTPGTYVVVAVEVMPDDDEPEPFPAGWTVLKLKED